MKLSGKVALVFGAHVSIRGGKHFVSLLDIKYEAGGIILAIKSKN